MPTKWERYPVSFRGGLVSSLSLLQQGQEIPGSARSLVNFEPSTTGGYRRIKGYSKYSEDLVPNYGEVCVQGSGQSGTSLLVANLSEKPNDGEKFTIGGIPGTYTIVSSVYSTSNKEATLTLSTPLSSSPSDQAKLTFTNNSDLITGIVNLDNDVLVVRNNSVWKGNGTSWVLISKPDYGTTLVDGGGQSGASLVIDGLTNPPTKGDVFQVTGISGTYTVLSDATVSNGSTTLSIHPNLTSSPSDNAVVSFIRTGNSTPNKTRWTDCTFDNTKKIIGVDGFNKPFSYDGTSFVPLDVPSDVNSASYTVEFNNHIFLAQGTSLAFSVPFNEQVWSIAAGAGIINLPSVITGLVVFRNQLIVFCEEDIYRVTGSSVADFQSFPISKDIGCNYPDTIQEVGGDVIFLSVAGLRYLSATDRINDFGLSISSRPIQQEFIDFVNFASSITACNIRSKNQYRIFSYRENVSAMSSTGYAAVQYTDQSSQSLEWCSLRGFKVYVADSDYNVNTDQEIIVFANSSGYVYKMESGNSFDGSNIRSFFYTPYLSVNDPRLRKVVYKLHTYLNTSGSINGKATLKYDFDDPNIIQPESLTISSVNSSGSFYGSAIYGVSTYGGRSTNYFNNQAKGSGFVISVQYEFDDQNPPFSLDSLVLEFTTEDVQ